VNDRDRNGSDHRGRDGSDIRDKRLGDWIPAVAFAGVVFVASVVPIPGVGERPPSGGDGNGTAALLESIGLTDPFHLIGYAILAVLVSQATGRHVRGLLVAAAVAVGFGFGIELVQAPIPWRGFAWRDVLLNAVGAGLGVVGIRVVSTV